MARGAVRVLAAQVLRFTHGGEPASDHWPVAAAWELEPGRPKRTFEKSYNPAAGQAAPSHRACSADWYYDAALPSVTWREQTDAKVPGADYACAESSIDLKGNLTGMPPKQLNELQGVCRVCAKDAAAMCAAHGERCAARMLEHPYHHRPSASTFARQVRRVRAEHGADGRDAQGLRVHAARPRHAGQRRGAQAGGGAAQPHPVREEEEAAAPQQAAAARRGARPAEGRRRRGRRGAASRGPAAARTAGRAGAPTDAR